MTSSRRKLSACNSISELEVGTYQSQDRHDNLIICRWSCKGLFKSNCNVDQDCPEELFYIVKRRPISKCFHFELNFIYFWSLNFHSELLETAVHGFTEPMKNGINFSTSFE